MKTKVNSDEKLTTQAILCDLTIIFAYSFFSEISL